MLEFMCVLSLCGNEKNGQQKLDILDPNKAETDIKHSSILKVRIFSWNLFLERTLNYLTEISLKRC